LKPPFTGYFPACHVYQTVSFSAVTGPEPGSPTAPVQALRYRWNHPKPMTSPVPPHAEWASANDATPRQLGNGKDKDHPCV